MEIDAGFDSFFEEVKKILEGCDTSYIKEHIAIHVNVTDMGNRPFYIEIADGDINVEPYGYYNNDTTINADSQIIIAMITKQADLRNEYTLGRVGAYGNLYNLSILRDLIVSS